MPKTKIETTENFIYNSSLQDIDKIVGHRLRAQRIFCRLSQETLATGIGITSQQLQKYEKGTNRIPASRLYCLSQALNIPVSYFFQEYEANVGMGAYEERKSFEFCEEDDAMLAQLILEYKKIKDVTIRQKLLELAKILSTESYSDDPD